MKGLESYSIDNSKSIRKSVVVWGSEGNISYPIMYISKPKHINQEDFDRMIEKMELLIHKED